jgi:hypothetical protein
VSKSQSWSAMRGVRCANDEILQVMYKMCKRVLMDRVELRGWYLGSQHMARRRIEFISQIRHMEASWLAA